MFIHMIFEIYFCTSSTIQILFILLNISLKKRENNAVLYLVNVVQQHTSSNEQGRTDNFLDIKSIKKKLLCGSYLPVFATDKPMAFVRTEAIILNKHADNIIVCNETVC